MPFGKVAGGAPFRKRHQYGAGEGAVAWTPAELTTALWLTAGPTWCFTDAGGTVAAGNGDAVRVWKDRSGNARDVSQGTAGSRPTLRLDGGAWYVDFDGTADCMSRATAGLPTAAPLGIFCVARDEDGGAQYRFAAMNDKWRVGSAGGPAVFTNPGVADYETAGVVFTAATLVQVSCEFDASFDVTWRRNGSAVSVIAGGADLAGGDATAHVGQAGGDSQFWKGRLAELVIVGSQLTTGDRAELETYLMTQWGL